MKTSIKSTASILILAVLLSACGAVSALQAIVDSTAAAIPILQAAGVPVPPAVVLYVGAVAGCIASLPATPTTAQILTVSSCFSSQVAPSLPPGTPQVVVNIITAIIKDVTTFLNQNPPKKSVAAGTAKPLNPADLQKFQAMRLKSQQTVEAVLNLQRGVK